MQHCAMGHLLSQSGRQAEALRETQRARELILLSAMVHAISSQVAFQGRDYPSALEHARRAVSLDQEFWIGHIMKGHALYHLGQMDQAMEALTLAARFSNNNSKAVSMRGYLLADDRPHRGSPRSARGARGRLTDPIAPPYAMALITAGLGGQGCDLCLARSRRSTRRPGRSPDVPDRRPQMESPFRADARFQSLLERCGHFMHTAAQRQRTSSNDPGQNLAAGVATNVTVDNATVTVV